MKFKIITIVLATIGCCNAKLDDQSNNKDLQAKDEGNEIVEK